MIRPRPLHTCRSLAATYVLSLAFGLTPAATAQPAPPRELTARAASAFESGRYADALRDLDQARGLVDPAQPELAAQLDFNRSCALLKLEKPAEAEKVLRDLDARRGLDRTLRAEVRYNLGLLEAQHAETLAKSDPPRAIEALRSAERRFRNALADSPGDADAARNIDIVQRRRAELMKQQEQQEQQQEKEQQQNKSDKQDQQKQDQKPEDDKSQSGDKQQDGKQQKSAENPQNPDQRPEQKQASSQQQDKQQKAGSGQQNKSTDGKQGEKQQQPDDQARQEQPKQQPRQRHDEGNPKDSAKPADEPNPAQADPSATEQREPRNPREFDVAAAQILDKERLRREQIRRMLQQMMRSRAVKADKDW